MRLGGPVHTDYDGPTEWATAVDEAGYGAAYCPIDTGANVEAIHSYRDAARDADIEIVEVHAFGHNPISPDEQTRSASIEACKLELELADEIGARCCVNVAGSRGDRWASPHPENFTDETFDFVVETVQEILDDIDPDNAAYTLEPMPRVVPGTVAIIGACWTLSAGSSLVFTSIGERGDVTPQIREHRPARPGVRGRDRPVDPMLPPERCRPRRRSHRPHRRSSPLSRRAGLCHAPDDPR